MQVFAVLGSHPTLSIAEWQGVIHAAPSYSTEKIALFDNIEHGSLHNLQHRLGGTQRIGHIVGSFSRQNTLEIAEFLASLLLQEADGKKISYGISIFSDSTKSELSEKQQQIGMTVKSLLKEQGFSARYVTSKLEHLSSVVIRKNQLIEDGAEFVLIEREKELLIGMTGAVQDVDDWSTRDYGRPARDAKRGMLPPKLARMMLNLNGNIEDKIVFDPFCGSGTVLMEAILLNAKKIIGTDILPEAIEDTRKNLLWLEQTYNAPVPELLLSESTAANTGSLLQKESVDAIVTEPFLGKPRKGDESEQEVARIVEELNTLYRQSFSTLVGLLKKGGVIVVASPVHTHGSNAFPVATRSILKDLGCKETRFSKEPLLYRHKGQFVGREILRFEK